MKFFKSHHPLWQFGRSVISSMTAFSVDFLLLLGLTEVAKLHYLISAGISFTAGTTVNYIISDKWVFKKRKVDSHKAGYTLFYLISLVTLVLNLFVIWLCTDRFEIHYLISRIIAGITIFIVSFTLRKLVVFH